MARGRTLDPPRGRIVVPVEIEPGRPPEGRDAQALLDAIGRSLDARERAGSLRTGRVFCFFCETTECIHALPRESDEVFDGYAPTGRPRWVDLPTLLLEARDPRVDGLYDGEDLVALVETGKRLRSDLIAEFGRRSGTYELLGQVAAGFFDGRGSNRGPRAEKVAATFQVVRTDPGDGKIHLHLNAISASPLFRNGAEGGADPDVGRILSIARRRLSLLERELQVSMTPRDPAEAALPTLRALARDLEHHDRVASRRTRHGVERSQLGVRPTANAFPDALAAPDERFLLDEERQTLVVLGRGGRVHVFTLDGRHVTSAVYRGDEIERKRRTGRWKPVEPARIPGLRRALQGRSDGRG